MKIGIFGGSFDPLHYGHLISAQNLMEKLKLHTLFFVPTNNQYIKKKTLLSPSERIDLIHEAIYDVPGFRVSAVDIIRGGKTYSIDTVRDIKKTYCGENKFYLLIGSDCLKDLYKWKEYKQLKKEVTIYPFHRCTIHDLNLSGLDYSGKIIKLPNIEISSTDIKKRLKQGKSIRYLVPPNVYEYLMKKMAPSSNSE